MSPARVELPASVIMDYRLGFSTRDIARAHGCTVKTVYKYLRRNNVPLRKPRRRHELPGEEMAERYRQGWTLAELATHYDVAIGTVARLFDDLKVKRRPAGGARSPRRG